MENGQLHKLEIKDGVLYLDGATIKGLVGYELKKSSVEDPTELFLKVLVED